ncbi:kelch repeat-containing protein, partial [Methanoculleus chikugoensis]|uniref:kelch repeat-containing protein n=1 Tax=Methanoculleus chikugoensis TaxID=118126 RepID=UPI000AC5EB21
MAKRHRSTPAVVLFLFIAALSLLVGTAGAVPEANFTSNVISGAAPLTVEFNDTSTGSPTGWAWYFGDETYNSTPWTRVNASAWPARLGHTSVVMPNGSIVLMGGAVGETWQYYKDVWRSDDNGETWTRVIENAPWSARYYPSAVAMPDGSIVIMGGNDDSFRNDVWRSGDYGGTWTGVPAGAWWSARFMHTSVVLPNGSIILMGGWDNTGYKNDVWKSTDNGTTWTRVIENAPWSTRYEHTAVAMPDGSIVLMGGSDGSSKNDVWRSFNGGETWTRVIENAPWSARTGHTSVAMPDGSIVLMGGSSGSRSDVWRSTDNGTTWTEVTGGAEWSARLGHTSVVLHNGSILLMGGSTGGNEVWRLDTAGSNNQSPTYTYTTPGTYTVALQAYNDDGYNATRKIGYITVTAPAPTAAFTANRTSGTVPLAVQFNDTSTGGPTSWSWNFGDGATSIDQNATHTYAAAGTYNVSLTVSNAAGSNTYTGDNYITVSAAPVAPAAAFTANRTSGPAPLAVQFTDASTGGPAGWAWFFGDEKYDGAWTGANASAGWSARRGHSSVALPDGSIVLMGGDESFGNTKNDAWRSTDGGGNWTCVNASSGWTPRWNHAAVAMPDGSIILMGGDEGAGNMKNDTWRS